jgi:hypothetical protein
MYTETLNSSAILVSRDIICASFCCNFTADTHKQAWHIHTNMTQCEEDKTQKDNMAVRRETRFRRTHQLRHQESKDQQEPRTLHKWPAARPCHKDKGLNGFIYEHTTIMVRGVEKWQRAQWIAMVHQDSFLPSGTSCTRILSVKYSTPCSKSVSIVHVKDHKPGKLHQVLANHSTNLSIYKSQDEDKWEVCVNKSNLNMF